MLTIFFYVIASWFGLWVLVHMLLNYTHLDFHISFFWFWILNPLFIVYFLASNGEPLKDIKLH